MQLVGMAQKVTIYIGDSDHWHHQPLYMAILELLRREDCAGATVTRGTAGFGAHSRIHTASLVDLSADLPIIIEWVDSAARVQQLLPRLQEMVNEGLITVQPVEVLTYTHRRLRELPMSLPVQDIMSREVHAVRPDTPVVEAVKLLLDKVYRALPVTDEAGRVVGILTEGDLLAKTKLLATSVQQGLQPSELDKLLQQIRQSGQTVQELMTANPYTVTPETTVPEAVSLMVSHYVKRLLVVGAGHKLVGIVSRVDVLRALAQPGMAEMPRPMLPPGSPKQVGQIMLTQVPTVLVSASLAEVVNLLVSHARRRVVVIDATRQVVGIITDGDLLNRATEKERGGILQSLSRRLFLVGEATFHLNHRTAAEVMTAPVITTTPTASLGEALQLLLHHRIKRLPVVNEQGALVGLIGRADILQALALHQ